MPMKIVTPNRARRRLDKRKLSTAIARRLAWHQAVHDPMLEPRNRLRWLQEVRRWQAARLATSFQGFLRDPKRRPAAEFCLTDL